MKASLVSEFRKFLTTRMWWVLGLAMVAYLVFTAVALAAVFAWAPESETALLGQDTAITIYSLANSVGYPFALVVGTLAVTAEYRHHTIAGTLLANPSRDHLALSKMIAAIPIGVLYGGLGIAAVLLGSVPIFEISGSSSHLGDGDVLAVLGFSVLALALWTMVGVGFGLVVPNQVAAVVIIIGFTQFVEPLARIALGFVDGFESVADYFPGAAADALVGGASFFALGGPGAEEPMGRLAGGLILVAYAVVFALIGRYTTLRRDIN